MNTAIPQPAMPCFFSQHCHVIGVEKRDFKTYMKRRFVHGTVVTGSHVAPLHTIIFHEIDYFLLSFCEDSASGCNENLLSHRPGCLSFAKIQNYDPHLQVFWRKNNKKVKCKQ